MDEWLTTNEVAQALKVTPETVKRWLRSGELRGSILSDRGGWRVKRSEVDRFMESKEPVEIGGDEGKATPLAA